MTSTQPSSSKPWYQSLTIWSVVAAVACGLLARRGVSVDQNRLTADLVDIAQVLAGLLAVYGRLRAKSNIGAPASSTSSIAPLAACLALLLLIGCRCPE